jgi:hypothetical protein
VSGIQIAAMRRSQMPEADRRDFYLYVDEFQNFATDSFATILSEARKYRLNLTIANQYLAQMDEATLPRYNAYVRLLIEGHPSRPFSMRTPPLRSSKLDLQRADIIQWLLLAEKPCFTAIDSSAVCHITVLAQWLHETHGRGILTLVPVLRKPL